MPSGPKNLSKKQFEQLASFRYELRKFLRFSEEAAHAAGITPQQHQAMLAIKGFPDRDYVTMTELAERLQTQHHSAVGLVDRLGAEDLVSRETDPADRRKVVIRLTKKGETILQTLSVSHKDQLARMQPELRNLLHMLDPNEPANGVDP